MQEVGICHAWEEQRSFPSYTAEVKQPPQTYRWPPLQGVPSCLLALELHAVQEEVPRSSCWAVLPWWLQQHSKARFAGWWQPAASAEPNAASIPQCPATFPLPQDLLKDHNSHFPAPTPLALRQTQAPLLPLWYINSFTHRTESLPSCWLQIARA